MFNKHKTLSTLKFLSYGTAFSFLSFLSFNALFPAIPSNAATSATAIADLELEVEPTIEVAVDTETLNLAYNNETDILPTSEGVTATGDINVYVTTNGLSGYTLSLYTQNATNEMKNINSAVSTSISATNGGVADLASNTWGFKYGSSSDWEAVSDDITNPSVLVSSNNPSTTLCNGLGNLNGNTEALEQCVTNGSASKATVTFGANITDTLPAGRYTNDVVFSAIAKAPSAQHHYAINYNKNNAEATGSTANTSAMYPGTATALSDGTGFTYEGMRVAGWAFTEGATEVAEVGSSNTPLTAGATNIDTADLIAAAQAAGQDVSEDKSGKITLYAIWEVATIYFQTANSCSTIPEGETAALVDSRDGQEYTVYHIPSNAVYPSTSTVANVAGKCIMTKDLNLGAVASVEGSASTIAANGAMTLSPEDSNFTTPTGSGESITVPTTSVSITNGTGSWNTSTNSYSNKQYTTSGTGNYAGRGYYSWGAAMTVCPKGWRLPTDAEYNDNSSNYNASTTGISKLVNNNLSTIQSSPWSFVLGGYYYGSFSNAGSYGYYWSSAQNSSSYSYILSLNSSNGLKRNFGNKYIGFSVRCIAD